MRRALQLGGPAIVVAVLAMVIFLVSGPLRFPMDDTYIHLVYGRNLATHGLLSFNLAPPDHGIGTTSILWTLWLALCHPVLGVEAGARLGGMLAGLLCVLFAGAIAGWLTPHNKAARFTAMGLALSGNLLWFSLSGMETMLWVALGLGALVAYRRRQFVAAGFLLGAMALTRIEGVVLLAAMWAVELVARRRYDRRLWLTTAMFALCLLPWTAIVHAKTGHWLPTSFAGKKQAQVRASVEVMKKTFGSQRPGRRATKLSAEHLPPWVALIYPMACSSYGLAFVIGAAYLPGPRIPLPGVLGEQFGGLAVLGVLLVFGLFGPCAWHALRRGRRWLREELNDRRAALLVLLVWVFLTNVAYWLKLPTPGTASRYQVLNHVSLWLLCGAGAWWLPSERWRQPAAVLLVVLGLVNAGWWSRVYGADCRHMEEVRLAAARHIARELPPQAVVAAHDIGAVGWLGGHRVLDLGGLIDPAYLDYAKANRLREWLARCGATHVVLPTKHSSEKGGFYDYAAFLGFDQAHGIKLTPERHFENDFLDWRRGAGPTWNALPGVTVYRLELAP